MEEKNNTHQRFELVKKFPMEVPSDFSWKVFKENNWHNFFGGIQIKDPSIIKDFAGKKLTVHLYEITSSKWGIDGISSEECIGFIKSKNGILPNLEGIATVWLTNKEQLPYWDYVLAFDEKELLPSAAVETAVPFMRNVPDGWIFGWHGFEDKWFDEYHILFFTE